MKATERLPYQPKRSVVSLVVIDDPTYRQHIIDVLNSYVFPISMIEIIIVVEDLTNDYYKVKLKELTPKYIELFQGSFYERLNRGIGLSSSTFTLIVTKESYLYPRRVIEDCEYLNENGKIMILEVDKLDITNYGTITMTEKAKVFRFTQNWNPYGSSVIHIRNGLISSKISALLKNKIEALRSSFKNIV